MRLAERNGGIRPGDLARGTMRSFPKHSLDPEEAFRFSVFAQLSLGAVFRLCFINPSPRRPWGPERNLLGFMGQQLATGDFVSKRRVCVRCLGEAPYERRIWSVQEVHGCTVHDVPFVEVCQSCGLPLTFEGLLMTCRCGQRLDRVPPPEWTRGAREATKYVVCRLLGTPITPIARLDAIRLTDALTLIRAFGMIALTGPPEGLFQLVLSRSTRAVIGRNGRSWTGALQLQLPGLAPPGYEVLAALVREASGYRLPPGQGPMDAILDSEAAENRRNLEKLGIERFGDDGFDYWRRSRIWNVPLTACDCWFARRPSGQTLGPFKHAAFAVASIDLELARSTPLGEGPIWAPSAENLPLDRGWRAESLRATSSTAGFAVHQIIPLDQQPFFVVSGPKGVRENFRTADRDAAEVEAALGTADPPAEDMSPAEVLALWEPPEVPPDPNDPSGHG